MTVSARSISLFVVSLCLLPMLQTLAQTSEEEGCDGKVYRAAEVSKRAKVLEMPASGYTDEARANRVRGTVVLTAVFCSNGRIANIKVIHGLPDGLTEKAVEATRAMKFKPAQKDDEPVSQRFQREFIFNLY